MTRRGWTIAALAGAVSLALHASGLIALAPERPESLAGGPTQLAMIGNSFEDAVAGKIAGGGDPVETPAAEPPRETVEPVRATAAAP
ncbi:MAG: hypothetical protein ACOCTP_05435, partial [Roseicyclus sp.]